MKINKSVIGATLFIVAYFTLLLIRGDDNVVVIHDYLDSVFVTSKTLAESNKIFSSSSDLLPNGPAPLPRLVYGTEYSFSLLFFNFFSPLQAHFFNQLLMTLIAFFSFYFLTVKHFSFLKTDPTISVLCALAFALLPFWPGGNLSVAGLPLALYSFLNIRKNDNSFWNWFILFLIPFYSSLFASFMFFLVVIFLLFLLDLWRFKKFNAPFFFAILLMSLTFIFVEYRLFSFTFNPFFTPHRVNFTPNYNSLSESILEAGIHFFTAQYHAHSLHSFIILPLTLLAILYSLKNKIKGTTLRVLVFLLFFNLLVALNYAFWRWEGIEWLVSQNNFIKSFNFRRFHWLTPLSWYLCFYLSLSILNKAIPRKIVLQSLVFLTCSQIFINIGNASYWKPVWKKNLKEQEKLTYKQFFSEKLFTNIKEFLGNNQNDYSVISIGLHPSIASYNNFKTADFYYAFYPMDYKQTFREIVSDEFSKNNQIRDYYDIWGNRVYAFTDALSKDMFGKGKTAENIAINTSLNIQALKKLNIKYIFSRVPIANQFQFLKKFESPESYWDIFLYQVD